MKKIIAICLIISSVNACKTKPEKEPEIAVENEGKRGGNASANEQPCLIILPEKPIDYEGEDYNFTSIDSAYFIEGNIYISYQYSGCTEGEPVLAVIESAQGKRSTVINLNLKVRDAGLCEMLIQRESCFTLSETATVGKEFQVILNNENTFFYRP